jgi:hypothetical protein
MAGVKPFPVSAPIRPEERQIGRRPGIDALYKQVVEHREHTLLVDERRVGKTSMVWAVLDRIRDGAVGWAIEVNLSRGPITKASVLAEHHAEQARASHIRVDPRKEQIVGRLRGSVKLAGKPIIGTIGKLLGSDELTTAAEVAQSIDQSLAPSEEGEADLRAVLRALIAAAVAADKVLVLFVDEAQRLRTDWADEDDSLYAQEALAEVMEDHAGHVVVVLAGSERAALEQLLADGQPLHHDGVSFPIRPISDEDWHYELPRRFREAGVTVDRERIDQILDATGRHPENTMRVCLHVSLLAEGEPFEVSEVLVDEAIKDAQRHPSWHR